MACDIRVAAEDAQLGQPEIKLGLIPGGGGTQRLPRLVGHGRALYLNLTGDPISGAQAYEWGLVERAVPRAELHEAAMEIAGTLAERSPHSMAVIKELAAADARSAAGRGPAQGGAGVHPLHRQRGRRRGRDGVPREAHAAVHRPMRAAVLHEVGGPLSVEDVPEPDVAEGQSLVEVRAAGVNFADVLIRLGRYPQPPQLPTILGNEIAGDLDGRRVLAFVRHSAGGYAERVAVDDEWVFDLPPDASYARGRGVPDDVPDGVDPAHPPDPVHVGTRVLVTAAAGGVGTAAIQVATFAGATVIAAAGSEEKRELAQAAGCRAGGLVRGDRGARRHRRRVRPGRRRGLRLVPQVPAAARGRDRDRLRRRRVGAGRPGPARRPQHRRSGLLPRPPDAASSRSSSAARSRSCSRCGGAARSGRSSAASSRSRRRRQRTI